MTVDPRTVIRDKVAMALLAWNEPVRTWEASYGMVRRQYQSMADVAIAAHLEALEQTTRIESDRVSRVRAICQEALTNYIDDGEPVLAQCILDALDGKEP